MPTLVPFGRLASKARSRPARVGRDHGPGEFFGTSRTSAGRAVYLKKLLTMLEKYQGILEMMQPDKADVQMKEAAN
jgi:hypothetical protein